MITKLFKLLLEIICVILVIVIGGITLPLIVALPFAFTDKYTLYECTLNCQGFWFFSIIFAVITSFTVGQLYEDKNKKK